MNRINKLVNLLRISLEKYPMFTNSLSYGSFCVTAEFTQQTITRKLLDNKPYDVNNIIHYGIYATGLAGPLLTFWYRNLDRMLVGTSAKIVSLKVLADSFIFTPQLLFVFYTSMSIMEGKEDIFAEYKRKFIPTLIVSCSYWIPAQAINFIFVSPTFRVVFISGCAMIWANILVYMKRKEK